MKRNQSVQKAVAILRAVGAQTDGESASSLARAAGLPHPTALRLIHTLEEEGFLMRLPGNGRYVLGLDLLRLAPGAETGELLLAIARRELSQLADETLETATLSIPRGRDALEIVLQCDGPHLLGPVNWVGGRYPLHASAGGKVLLASHDDAYLARFVQAPLERCTPKTITAPVDLMHEIQRVRERGYSTVVDELEDGLAAIGAPILDAAHSEASGWGRLIGVVNLSGPAFRFDHHARQAATARLLATADAIARELLLSPRGGQVGALSRSGFGLRNS